MSEVICVKLRVWDKRGDPFQKVGGGGPSSWLVNFTLTAK